MIKPTVPAAEEERLSELYAFAILDTEQESEYDRILDLAMLVTDTPMGTITFVDRDRQWFKSRRGVGLPETSREISFCGHGILNEDLFVVRDARSDLRFHDNPLVTKKPGVGFYAGMPLITEGGHRIGMLCVQDTRPRELSHVQLETIRRLADSVMHLLHRRRTTFQIGVMRQEVQHRVHNTLQFLSSLLSVYQWNSTYSAEEIIADFGQRIIGLATLTRALDSVVSAETITAADHLYPMIAQILPQNVDVQVAGSEGGVNPRLAVRVLTASFEIYLIAQLLDRSLIVSLEINLGERPPKIAATVTSDRDQFDFGRDTQRARQLTTLLSDPDIESDTTFAEHSIVVTVAFLAEA